MRCISTQKQCLVGKGNKNSAINNSTDNNKIILGNWVTEMTHKVKPLVHMPEDLSIKDRANSCSFSSDSTCGQCHINADT